MIHMRLAFCLCTCLCMQADTSPLTSSERSHLPRLPPKIRQATSSLRQSLDQGRVRLHHFGDNLQRPFDRMQRAASARLPWRSSASASLSLPAPQDTQKVLEQVLFDIDHHEGWDLVASHSGWVVYKQMRPGEQLIRIKAIGELAARPSSILSLLKMSEASKIRLYNPMYADGCDLQQLSPTQKVSWASSNGVFPVAARDFITLVTYKSLPSGMHVVLNQHINHPVGSVNNRGMVRGKIMLGAHVITQGASEDRCKYHLLQQLDLGGLLPVKLVNLLAAREPISYFKRIEGAAQQL